MYALIFPWSLIQKKVGGFKPFPFEQLFKFTILSMSKLAFEGNYCHVFVCGPRVFELDQTVRGKPVRVYMDRKNLYAPSAALFYRRPTQGLIIQFEHARKMALSRAKTFTKAKHSLYQDQIHTLLLCMHIFSNSKGKLTPKLSRQ